VFFLVLIVVMLTPLTEHNIWVQVPVTCLATLTVLLALRRSYIPRRRVRQLTVMAVITAVMIIATNIFIYVSGNEHRFILAVSALFMCIVVGIAIPSMLVRVFTDRRVTLNVLAGALAAYLLVGLWFASLFGLLSALSSDDVTRESTFFAQTTHPATAEYEYFSFITITTVGYGDLTPGNNAARTGAIGEAVLGQVFLVTVVARVVSSLGQERAAQGSLRRRHEDRPSS
jgi:hypothetical protein